MENLTGTFDLPCPIGGAIYDTLHVHCAELVSAHELRTLDGRDFRRMPPANPTQLVVL